MKTRWTILLLLSSAIIAGLFYVDSHKDAKARQERRLASVRSELQQVRRLERELQQKARIIHEWNILWASVEDAGLDPQHDWFVNPINTRATAEWPDIADLISYVSYGDEKTTGYWFAPEFLHINRVLAGPEGPATFENNGTASGTERNESTDLTDDQPATFQVHLKGQFLVPRD